MKNPFMWFFRLLLPNRCVFCSRIIKECEVLCPDCLAKEKKMRLTACPKCGHPFRECKCHAAPSAPDLLLYPFSYRQETIASAIKRFKKNGYETYAHFFALRMAVLAESYPEIKQADAICSIPTHASSLLEKGFNHADILASHLSELLQLEHKHLLVKVKQTAAQKTLTAAQRKQNLRGCFAVTQSIPPAVVLVDDITTTGSTLQVAVRTLKKNGAKKVYCLTVAAVI